jgi:hypothetical protein
LFDVSRSGLSAEFEQLEVVLIEPLASLFQALLESTLVGLKRLTFLDEASGGNELFMEFEDGIVLLERGELGREVRDKSSGILEERVTFVVNCFDFNLGSMCLILLVEQGSQFVEHDVGFGGGCV